MAPNIAQATASANRILNIREPDRMKIKLTPTPQALVLDSSDGADITLQNVSFQYPARPNPVFRNLSITIPSGSFVALVGPSGCGKTSIISLLERFYTPSSGTILVNNNPISTLDIVSYRAHLSLVSQEPKLFSGTVRENLLLGVPENSVSDDQIQHACRDAEIHDFILSLPSGYGTDLGTHNSSATALSGGQKQRLCLARALLRKPKLLLLDEATSSLDCQSERLVQNAIERLAGQKNMTVVAVAHRLATVQGADCIFVFGEEEEGRGSRLLERGMHLELLGRRGVYWEMCQGQALDR